MTIRSLLNTLPIPTGKFVAESAAYQRGAIIRCLSKIPPKSKRYLERSYATTSITSFRDNQHDGILSRDQHHTGDRHHTVPTDATVQESSKSWITLLDPYLPLELRSETWLENLTKFQGVRSAESLPAILDQISIPAYEFGPLVHLAVKQSRWHAYLFLAKALLQQRPTQSRSCSTIIQQESPWIHCRGSLLQRGSPWQDDPDIEAVGNDVIVLPNVTASQSLPPIDAVVDTHPSSTEEALYHRALGQIWHSLGIIVLQAADAERDLSEYMMSQVHQVIALIHSEGQMHPLIYTYGESSTPTVLRKPPLLHVMRSRLMVTLSDSVWKATENDIIGSYALVAAAHSLSGPMEEKDLYPRMRQIGHQVWLELILWACVHENHATEAALIIRDMSIRVGARKWRTVGWSSLHPLGPLHETAVDSAEESRLRFDRIAGSDEGYSDGKPPLRGVS